MGAETTSELNQLQLDANSYETDLSNLTATIDALPDEEDLNDKIATYQLRAEEKVEKPKGTSRKEILVRK